MADNSVRFKDFTKKRLPVFFTLDDERFDCYPALGLPSIQELGRISTGFTVETAVESMVSFFSLCMDEENLTRMTAKIGNLKEPVDQDQAVDIMSWLMEVYSLRPTASSPASSDGSPTGDDGTPSGAGD
jgi:hypothetical protein